MKKIALGLLYQITSCLYFISATYDPNKALTCAYASALSHCKPSDIEAWNCGVACQNLTGFQNYFSTVVPVTFDQSVAFAMIVNPSTKTFVTSFRGTASPVQFILEVFEYQGVPYNLSSIPGAQIEEYFYKHYVNYLRELVIKNLQTAVEAYPDYEFIFTGHSLGAAFTTLAAYDSITSNITTKNQTVVYNYGSPRVGNYIFAKAVQGAVKEIYRVTHWRDPVPHVPPCLTDETGECMKDEPMSLLDYERMKKWPLYHVSQEIFYNEENSDFVLCHPDEEDPNCVNQFKMKNWKGSDHDFYLGVAMDCKSNSSDVAGNFLEKNFDKNYF